MSPAKGLHLLIGRPAKLKGDVYASLFILGAVRSMKRDSHSGGIADNRNALLARLKLCHFVNVGSVHCDAFGRALLVLNPSARVTNKAARSSGEFGNVALTKVIDKLVKRVLRQL
jgi:hypothetical protein